jgi:hypothetical protein
MGSDFILISFLGVILNKMAIAKNEQSDRLRVADQKTRQFFQEIWS